MVSIALPAPVVALFIGALIVAVVVGAISICLALQFAVHKESARIGDALASAAILLGITYGIGWAALRFL